MDDASITEALAAQEAWLVRKVNQMRKDLGLAEEEEVDHGEKMWEWGYKTGVEDTRQHFLHILETVPTEQQITDAIDKAYNEGFEDGQMAEEVFS